MWPFARKVETQERTPPRVALPPTEPKSRLSALAFYGAPAEAESRNGYTIPEPPPGVVPQNTPLMAADDAISNLYTFAAAQQSLAFNGQLGPTFPGYTFLAELAQRPEFRRGTAIVAEEMTRKWVKLVTAGDEKADRMKALEQALERFAVRDVFHKVLVHDGFFGIGHIFLDMGVQGDEIAKPLPAKPEKVAIGSLKGIRTVDPVWCYPAQYNTTNPLADDFYRPGTWYVMGRAVHSDRLLSVVTHEVPDILKPAYMFGGLSRTMMAFDYVQNFLRTRQSVSDLLHSFSTMVLKTDLSSLMQPGVQGNLLSRVQAFIQYRDNRGLMTIDKAEEDLSNVTTSLSTLDALQAQAYEQQASVQAIPLVKFAGLQPAGLNASSDGEIRVFYDSIHAALEKVVRPVFTRVLDIIQLSEFGEIDPEIRFEFEPLWQMNEIELATVQKTKADTHQVYVELGAVTQEEVRETLAADEASPYHGLDLSAPLPEPAADPADDPEMMAPVEVAEPAMDASFSEEDHPRASSGEFTSGSGSSGSGSNHQPSRQAAEYKGGSVPTGFSVTAERKGKRFLIPSGYGSAYGENGEYLGSENFVGQPSSKKTASKQSAGLRTTAESLANARKEAARTASMIWGDPSSEKEQQGTEAPAKKEGSAAFAAPTQTTAAKSSTGPAEWVEKSFAKHGKTVAKHLETMQKSALEKGLKSLGGKPSHPLEIKMKKLIEAELDDRANRGL